MGSVDFNIFVATDNGLLKGINTKTKSFKNLNNLENLTKEKEIFKMCWMNNEKQDNILFGTKDNHIVKYGAQQETGFVDFGQADLGRGILKGFEMVSDDKLMTCVEGGSLKIWSLPTDNKSDDENSTLITQLSELNVGSEIHCAKKSRFDSSMVATGGKENDLKIWDVNQSGAEAVFKAKNVADNWMQLREPVWIMSIDFVDRNKVAIGTAYHQVRVYDVKAGIRRPVYNLNYGQQPITSLCGLPNDSNRLVVANTRGDMELIDLRMAQNKTGQCTTLKKYKSFAGTIKSIEINESSAFTSTPRTYIATCGLDRFMRVHELETSQLVSKVYVKSRLNCLLFSHHEPIAKAKRASKENESDREEDEESNVNSEDLGTDDLWSDMETIVEEHPGLKSSSKGVFKRLKDFSSDSESNENEEDEESDEEEEEDAEFKKPKAIKKPNKSFKKPKKLK